MTVLQCQIDFSISGQFGMLNKNQKQ